jgi:hypothetical protein
VGEQGTVFAFDGKHFWKQTGETIEELSPLHARLELEIVQLAALANVLHETPLAGFGKVLLDGADKADQQIAYRIKTLDERNDWFYVWLSTTDGAGSPQVRLLKASSEKDGDRNGAVCFRDWREVHGIQFPHQRDFVLGLAETVQRQALTIDVSLLENVKDSQFQLGQATATEE